MLFQNVKNAQQHLSCNPFISPWKDNWFMSWQTFTDCKLHDSWKPLNTRADVSSKWDCKWDLSCFPASNTGLRSGFGVKHNTQLPLCTAADDLLSPNTMFHIGFNFLNFQLKNLTWSINHCGQWNKERKEAVGHGTLTRNHLFGEEMREIGGQWMRSQQQEYVPDDGKTDGHRDRWNIANYCRFQHWIIKDDHNLVLKGRTTAPIAGMFHKQFQINTNWGISSKQCVHS